MRGQGERTVLLTVELFDSVTGLVVLTENIFLLGFTEGRIVVPGSGHCLGSTIPKIALQKVDCTRNDRRVRNSSHNEDINRKLSVPSSTASDTKSKALASATEGIAKIFCSEQEREEAGRC
jgi:hypothetical protein